MAADQYVDMNNSGTYQKLNLKAVLLLALMLALAAFAQFAPPTIRIAVTRPRVDFEEVIPRRFGDLVELPSATAIV